MNTELKKNVLIFPCGSEIGLEINKSLAYINHFNVIGGSSVTDHGAFAYENYIDNIPFVDSPDFIFEINKIIENFKIDYIFPAHDSVVLKLSEAVSENLINCEVLTSDYDTCVISRSKNKTYNKLKNIVSVPEIYNNKNEIHDFPVFIKPDVGQGSKGAKIINSKIELNYEFETNSSFVISEYLAGNEYTIDCFTDKNGKLLYSEARIRSRISNGISVNTSSIDNPDIKANINQFAEKINNEFAFRGAWFFQLKEDKNNELKLLEFAPRIAGSMGYHRLKGVNLPLLTLYERMGLDVNIIENNYKLEMDRALYNSFKFNIDFENVYIDLDDTLIIDNKVNHNLISLLYKLKNSGKKLYLITRHNVVFSEKTEIFLDKHLININIFDKIINVFENENKSDYISNLKSIFIDDSFKERKDVSINCRIPVFDVNQAIEGL